MKLKSRWIPESHTEKREELDAVVYIDRARLCALGYAGKAVKPSFNYKFRSEEQMEKHISEFFQSRARSLEYKSERKKDLKSQKEALLSKLKVGDILVSSWGYDQTNVNFYEIVSVKGSTVTLKELAQNLKETGFMSGVTKPVKGSYLNKAEIKRVVRSGHVNISSCQTASLWNGSECYRSWYA